MMKIWWSECRQFALLPFLVDLVTAKLNDVCL